VPIPDQESLADRRQLVVVLRLVAGTTGQLLYGEVIDAQTGPIGRFMGWRGMTAAVRSWLAREVRDANYPDMPRDGHAGDQPAER
jgi:hypothetical protein